MCKGQATFQDSRGEFCDEHYRIKIVLSDAFMTAWLIKNSEKQQHVQRKTV
jgi:hypothetical protein